MVITDVGQSRMEEINYLPFKLAWGANFGWHDFEGTLPFNCGQRRTARALSTTEPIVPKPALKWPQLTYTHKDGCSIIGGPVVTDPALTSIVGRIVYGDFCTNRMRTALPDPAWITDDKPLGSYMPPGQGPAAGPERVRRGPAAATSTPSVTIGEIYKLTQTEVEIKPTRAEIVKWCAQEREQKEAGLCQAEHRRIRRS